MSNRKPLPPPNKIVSDGQFTKLGSALSFLIGALFGLGWVLIACMLAGCMKPAPQPVVPVDPEPVVLSPQNAAAALSSDYAKRLAVVADDVAKRAEAGEFEDLTAVNKAWFSGSKAAREQSQKTLIEAMNAALKDSEGLPGTAAAPLFQQLAAGFKQGGAK